MAGGMATVYNGSGTTTWHTWVTTSDTTAADTTSNVWTIWADSGTTGTSTITGDATWTTWVSDGTSIAYQPVSINQPATLTPEQIQEQERRREQQRQRDAEAGREREAAVARAEELLLEHLDEAQRSQYAREQSFRLIKGSKVYEIRRGRAGNVYLLDASGKREIEYCAHVIDNIPNEDNLLAQKFMLETDEDEFLRLANARRVAA